MQLKEGEKISIIGARQLAEEQFFFAGHGFPVLSAILAKKLYNSNLKICFESGAIYSNPERIPHSVSDIINYSSAQFSLDLPDTFAMLERGKVDVVGLSGAQMDKRGNINSTLINDRGAIKRLPKTQKLRIFVPKELCSLGFAIPVATLLHSKLWGIRKIFRFATGNL